MTNTSIRTVANPRALDLPPQAPMSADYPASARTQMSAAVTQPASNGYLAPLGYSEVPDDDPLGAEFGYDELPDSDAGEPTTAHEAPSLVITAVASILAVGAVALVVSLAFGSSFTGDQLPSSGEATIVPNSQPAVPAAPEVEQPSPSRSGTGTIQEPAPVSQQAPQTVYMTAGPAPQSPSAVVTAPEAAVPVPPQENQRPPVDPEPVDPEPAREDADETAEPTPDENAEPAPEDDSGSTEEEGAGAAPQDPGLAGMGQFSVLDRVPADPRLPIAGPPIISAPNTPAVDLGMGQ